jgi:hypothetical protein
MKMTAWKWAGAVVLSAGCAVAEQPRVLVSWDFTAEADKAWLQGAIHRLVGRIEDGVLKGTMMSWDPFITSPKIAVEASAGQAIEMRVRTSAAGPGNIYGCRRERRRAGEVEHGRHVGGGGAWHEYRCSPIGRRKRIARFRIDFSNPADMLGTMSGLDPGGRPPRPPRARRARGAGGTGAWRGEDGAAASVSGDGWPWCRRRPDRQDVRTLRALPARENVFVSV